MKVISVAYLASYFLSVLGNLIAAVALPLIVLQVTGSALGAGAVAAAAAIPAVLAGLLVGVVIDRVNRVTASVVCDLISFVSVAALPVIDMVSGVNLGWFILLGIIGSLGDVPGATAREALLPAIVRHGGISSERLVGLTEMLGAIALLLGPAAAGTLMVLFEGSQVLWITAATSLSAALLTLVIPKRVGVIDHTASTRAPNTHAVWGQLREGWRVLFRDSFLAHITLLSFVSAMVLASLQGLILPVYFTQIEQPGMLGFVFTAIAAGMLIGGTIYVIAGRRGKRKAWFVAGLLGCTAGFGVTATLGSAWVVFAGVFIVGISSGLFGSVLGVLLVERIPEQLRGRIMGTQNAIMTAAAPIAIVGAAVLTEYVSVMFAAIAFAVLWAVVVLTGVLSRSLDNLEAQPEKVENDEMVNVNA